MNTSQSSTLEMKIKKPSLSSRLLHSGAWILGSHVLLQVFRLAANLVMTRLLVPEMFGVMAIANVFLFGLALFSDIGLHHNIIQSNRGDDKSFLDTVWTTQIARGFVIFVIGALIGLIVWAGQAYDWFPAQSAYDDASLPLIIALLSFFAFLHSFESTKVATASRNLTVKKLKIIEFGSSLAGIAGMLCWAWFDRTVWAMVFGAFLSGMIKMVLSHTSLPGLPNSFHWNRQEFDQIFSFGKWVFVSSGLGFLFLSLDKLILGGIMSNEMFGLYSIAILILNVAKDIFSKVNTGVFFPALSEVFRNNPERFKDTYYKYRVGADIFLSFSAGFLFATAYLIIGILYDERYIEAGHIFQILSLGMIGLRNELSQQSFLAIGKPKIITIVMTINLVMLAIFLPLANHFYGTDAALWVVAASSLFPIPWMIKYKIDHNIFSLRKELIGLLFLPVGYVVGLGVVAASRWMGIQF